MVGSLSATAAVRLTGSGVDDMVVNMVVVKMVVVERVAVIQNKTMISMSNKSPMFISKHLPNCCTY